MKVLFYGRLAEAIGPELEVDASPGSSVADVRERLAAEHPNAAAVLRNKRALSFVGERLVRDDYRLAAGDTLEFLPPVSGG
jgi:sulfur-carrier protein